MPLLIQATNRKKEKSKKNKLVTKERENSDSKNKQKLLNRSLLTRPLKNTHSRRSQRKNTL